MKISSNNFVVIGGVEENRAKGKGNTKITFLGKNMVFLNAHENLGMDKNILFCM